MPVYAIIVSNIACDWGGYTLLTNIPTYMKEVLKLDITSVSISIGYPIGVPVLCILKSKYRCLHSINLTAFNRETFNQHYRKILEKYFSPNCV